MTKAKLIKSIEANGRYCKVRIDAAGQVTGMLSAEDHPYSERTNTGGRRYIGQYGDPDLMRDYEPDPVSQAAAILGRRGGQAKSPRKADTSRANGHAPCHEGKRRGRPMKDGTK
jgi:hypothetical protein